MRRYTPVWRQAEPFRLTWRDHLVTALTIARDVLGMLVVILAILVWVVVASASQVTP